MEAYFLYASLALCLFALWAIARRDWVRLTTISRQADAVVTGHRVTRDGDGVHYAATYRFSAEGREHEVVDQVLNARPVPEPGTRVSLTYPLGRPDLARIPRRLMWLAIYVVLIGACLLLLAVATGWLPQSGGDIPG